jgi:TonB family protein
VLRSIALVAWLVAAGALAQTLTRAPTLLKQVDPVYPAEAADAGTTAAVGLEIDLGPDGKVTDARVVQSGGPGFDEAALAAIRQFEFTPAEVDGKPAPVRLTYTLNFVMAQQVVEVPAPVDAGVPVVNLVGTLKAAGTREPVAGAQVFLGEGDTTREAFSDEAGHFEFTDAPAGSNALSVVATGFAKFTDTAEVKPGERTELVFYLRSTASGLETVVRGEKDRKEVSQVRLSQQELRLVPGTNADAFKVVQNLPGVARSPFGTGALVVRGSKAWDSRIYVDEVQIPQLFHFAGLTATFNSATVESIGFQPGNFGADYGRSTGGLILATVKSPSKSGVHGLVDVSLFDVSAQVEAPLSKDWSISVAGRRGLADVTLPFALNTFAPQLRSTVGFSVAPQYWDYQLRAERKGTGKNRVFVSLFGSSDRWSFVQPNYFLDLEPDSTLGNSGQAVVYNRLVVGIDHKLTDRLTLVSRNSVGFDINEQLGGTTDVFFRATMVPIQLRERLKWELPEWKLSLNLGLDTLVTPLVLASQRPPVFKANQIPDPYVNRRLVAQDETSVYVEPGLFLDATWTPVESLKVVGGVRLDTELGVMRKVWVNPRLTVLWSPLSFLTFKGGAGLYEQPPDYRQGLLSPTFGNPNLRAEGAGHFVGGVEARLFDLVEVDVQGYYKAFFNQARQTLLNSLGSDFAVPGVETRYSSAGYGRSYGAEFLVRIKPTKYFFGWVAYSLSRFERDYYGDVAFAPGPLDQPHNLIAVASVKLPFDFTFGARLRVASGPLVTPVIGAVYDTNGNYYFPVPGLPWSQRLPTFVQLDLRLDKVFVFDAWKLTVYADVQNALNTQNPEGLYYSFNYTQSAYVNGIPILPSVGLRGEW